VTAIEGLPAGIDPSEVVAVAERTAKRLGPLLAEVILRA
jgi:purine-nucleoside phosphorylase